MRKIACVMVVIFFGSVAGAQIPTSGNIFVGYSFENTNWSGLNSALSRPNLHGWAASLEGKVFPHLGIVTDYSAHYGSQSFLLAIPPGGSVSTNVTGHEWAVLFGPRLSIPVGKISPFGEALFGVSHINNGGFVSNANTSFATALGGGLDYSLVRILALRLEADYMRTRFFSTAQNDMRFSTGLVFRF